MVRPLIYASGTALGLVLMALPQPASSDAAMRALTGTLTYDETVELPPDAEVVLEFRARDGALLVSDRSRADGRQVPFPIRLWIPAERAGRFQGSIGFEGETVWRSPSVAVAAGTGPVDVGSLTMRQITPIPEPEEEPVEPEVQPVEPEPVPPEVEPEPPVEEPLVEEPLVEEPPVEEPEQVVPMEPPVVEPDLPDDDVIDVPEAEGARLLCGDTEILVTIGDLTAEITIGTTVIEMVQVGAPAGVRFEVPGDPDTFFWAQQDSVVLSLAGEALPDCLPIGPVQ